MIVRIVTGQHIETTLRRLRLRPCHHCAVARLVVRADGGESMEVEALRKKPACVLQRDAWLTELRQLEDRESLRPWLHKYGVFSTSTDGCSVCCLLNM